jgi:hypothetical protein
MWPVTWPEAANIDTVDPSIKRLAELYSVACLTFLTLQRVGGNPLTLMPDPQRREGYWGWTEPYPGAVLSAFYPGAYPSSEDLRRWNWAQTAAVALPGPVGAVTAVTVDGTVVDPGAYRVEDGKWLVRTDGGLWPAGQGDHFTVSYHNSYPVDYLGAHAAGILALEWLRLFTRSKDKCRLPNSITSISRQGINMQITPGMFPDGLTGIAEIDAYVMLWNPFGLKVAPRVYSLDLPRHRQVTG